MPTERKLPGTWPIKITAPSPHSMDAEIEIGGHVMTRLQEISVKLDAGKANTAHAVFFADTLAAVVEAEIVVTDAREVLECAKYSLVKTMEYQLSAMDRLLVSEAIEAIDRALRLER